PSTLLGLHKAMSKRKYRMLFSQNRRRTPGPKGPSAELIRAVVEMKQRNPNWGCPRIAQQIALAFHIPIDKDVARRILAHHHRPGQGSGGPSWLTFLGHMKDSVTSHDILPSRRLVFSNSVRTGRGRLWFIAGAQSDDADPGVEHNSPEGCFLVLGPGIVLSPGLGKTNATMAATCFSVAAFLIA